MFNRKLIDITAQMMPKLNDLYPLAVVRLGLGFRVRDYKFLFPVRWNLVFGELINLLQS